VSSSTQPIDPERFTDEWIAAWNNHDLEAILSHYDDAVVLRSPTAARIVPGSGGVISGKEALRSYWTAALSASPDLRFTAGATYLGADTIAIAYTNQSGRHAIEMLRFEAGLVMETWIAHGLF